VAGERPRDEWPRRGDVERELDRRELGWGEFWQTQLFTLPIVFVGTGVLSWFLERGDGGAAAVARAALLTTGLFGSTYLGRLWQRRTARRVIALCGGRTSIEDVPSTTGGRTRAGRLLFGGPPLRRIERRLVLQDLLSFGLVSAVVAVVALLLALSDVPPVGTAHEVLRIVAICTGPLAVVALLSASVVFLRGRR
jgi:hypothetical protein